MLNVVSSAYLHEQPTNHRRSMYVAMIAGHLEWTEIAGVDNDVVIFSEFKSYSNTVDERTLISRRRIA